jgi:hypothetical protein
MGGAKEAGILPGIESDTHQSLFAKMMVFAKGSTHPTGWSIIPAASPRAG